MNLVMSSRRTSLKALAALLLLLPAAVVGEDQDADFAKEQQEMLALSVFPSLTQKAFKASSGSDKGSLGFGAHYTLSNTSGDYILFMHPPEVCQLVYICAVDSSKEGNELIKNCGKNSAIKINNIKLEMTLASTSSSDKSTVTFSGGYIIFEVGTFVKVKYRTMNLTNFHEFESYCTASKCPDGIYDLGNYDDFKDIFILTSNPNCQARLSPVTGPINTGIKMFYNEKSEPLTYQAYSGTGRKAPTPLILPAKKDMTQLKDSNDKFRSCPDLFEMPFFLRDWQTFPTKVTELIYTTDVSERCGKKSHKDAKPFLLKEAKFSFMLEVVPKQCDWVRICIIKNGGDCLNKNGQAIDLIFLHHIFIPFDSDEARSFGVEARSLHSIRFRMLHGGLVRMGYPVQNDEEYVTEYMSFDETVASLRMSSNNNDYKAKLANIHLVRAPNCKARIVADRIEDNWLATNEPGNCLFLEKCTMNGEK